GIPVSKIKGENYYDTMIMHLGKELMEVKVISGTNIALNQPACFALLDGFIAELKPLQPIHLTRILSLSNTMLEDEKLGFFPLEEGLPVFLDKQSNLSSIEKSHITEAFEFLGDYAIPIGATEVILYRSDNQTGVLAVLTDRFRHYDKIRVLLSTNGYAGYLHSKIELYSPDGIEVSSVPNGLFFSVNSDETIEFRPNGSESDLYFRGQKQSSSMFRWQVRSKGDSPIYVKSIQRSHSGTSKGTAYPGTLEIASKDNMLTLVNELDLEEYLLTVVPSEMPIRFGLEALKVQAVAARSYAVRAIQSSGFRFYGAHLDDSTSSQVYNNISVQEIATHAVEATSGIIAFYGNEIVDTRFFSTSCGYTANIHEVWSNQENEFPSEKIPYLKAIPQYPGKMPNLDREENFRAFMSQHDISAYDQFSPFFRWKVSMSGEQLEAILSHTLPSLYMKQPLFVLTKTSEEVYESKEIPEKIGTLLHIEVLRRGEGGNIMELEITTTHGIYKIIKEYNIRYALAPVNYLGTEPIILHCHNGSIRENFPLLPSAFAYIDFTRNLEGNIENVTIYGGGYGHGVGMSQYGTYGLTLLGKTWREILSHYYPGCELKNLYEDR
ncbi:MAG: SpoIID/LytB domain-containing protein, partial [Clostridiales bacterium]|nr:SpoIID/LytB domain-containing protein [Clostridiales bacterium]